MPKISPIEVTVTNVPITNIEIEVHITFTRMYKLRLWLGYLSIRFLSFVWDCDVLVDEIQDEVTSS